MQNRSEKIHFLKYTVQYCNRLLKASNRKLLEDTECMSQCLHLKKSGSLCSHQIFRGNTNKKRKGILHWETHENATLVLFNEMTQGPLDRV